MEKLKGKIVIKTVELHTGGDPVRIVVSGISRRLVPRAETACEKWRGKKWQHSECMGAMLGVNHEEYREINGWHIIGTTIKTL